MKSDSLDCLKYLMFFFNLLIFICGAATLGVGIWAAVSAGSFRDILISNPVIFDGVYIIIAVGAALFLIGFLGCCGAIKESRCLLAMFFVFVLIIFIVEIVGGILVFVYLPQVENIAISSISAYNGSAADSVLITQGWNTVQATVACCGYNNYTDWKDNAVWNAANPGVEVPDSCCTRRILTTDGEIIDVEKCRQGDTAFINADGCKTKLSNYVWVVGGVALGILLVELLGMIFSCCLYRAIEE